MRELLSRRSFDVARPRARHAVAVVVALAGMASMPASTLAVGSSPQAIAIPTTTVLVSSPNPSLEGDPVTLTATVAYELGPVTAGSVTFTEGSTTLGTVSLNGLGQASLMTSAVPLGAHTIVATYIPVEQFLGSSDSLAQFVTNVMTRTVLTSSRNPSTVGDPVTFTASVSTIFSVPVTGGSVTFSDGATAFETVSVDAVGVASFTTSLLAAGSHIIFAEYSGAAGFDQNRTTLTQTVNALPPATSSTTTTTTTLPPSTTASPATTLTPTTSSTTSTTTPPTDPTVDVAREVVARGQTQTATGTGFQPGEVVTGLQNSLPLDLGTRTADANGNVSFAWQIRADETIGAHTVTITGESGTATTTFNVTGGILPATR